MSDDFYISTDKNLLDAEFIHDFICHSYWNSNRSMEQTMATIENSFCFGLYTKNKEQIGFGRIVTDYVFFGYFMDVIIDPKYQGKGLGKTLVEFMLNDETVKGLQTIALKTKNAHGLYERYGFNKVGDSPLWMSIDRQKLD